MWMSVYFRSPGPRASSQTSQHVWLWRDCVCRLPGHRMCCSRKESCSVQVSELNMNMFLDTKRATLNLLCWWNFKKHPRYDVIHCTQEWTKPWFLWEMDDYQPLWPPACWRVHLSTNPTTECTVTISLSGAGTWVIIIDKTKETVFTKRACSYFIVFTCLQEVTSGILNITLMCFTVGK